MRKAHWMAGNYGVMVHYLPEAMPCGGPKKMTVNEMADNFDVKAFVKELKDMGASWVIFPFGQNSGYYWSYNVEIEKRIPGICTRRDLAFELAVEIKKQGLRFIAYFPTEVDDNVKMIRYAFGWDLSPDKKVFMERWMKVVKYYGEKYGDLLDGWWFDGNYDTKIKTFKRTLDWNNSRFDEKAWFEAARAGNPDRITAMNDGANQMTYVFEQEEYIGGESSRNLEFYPWDYESREKQWHALICVDTSEWFHYQEGKIAPPKFSDEELFEYTKKCLDKKGGITWNIGIYEDGTMAEESVAQIKRLKESLGK
ncbi:MAG: alpha-L-fucosidase [Monoglobales bacterium]